MTDCRMLPINSHAVSQPDCQVITHWRDFAGVLAAVT